MGSAAAAPGLVARRIGGIAVDPDVLRDDFDVLDAHHADDGYDAFTLGAWTSHVLANPTGDPADTAFRPHAGARLTPLGRRLGAVTELVAAHVDLADLGWVRVFGLRDGLLAPHVDFLEFDEPGVRLQIPLRTDEQAVNSEDGVVFHLGLGEAWEMCTTRPHSARSGPGPTRLALCLDLAPGADPGVLRTSEPSRGIDLRHRPELTGEERESLLDRGRSVTHATLRDLFFRLAAVHFDRALAAAEVFALFVEACRRSGDPALVGRARAFRRYCLERRAYQEAFSW